MFLFVVFGAIALVAALGVVLSRKPVYSALFLLLNFGTLAALYIMLEAQFLATVQVIVYAGAIVVLFLFVLMLIGGGDLRDIRDSRLSIRARFTWSRVTAVVLAVLFVAALTFGIVSGVLVPGQDNVAAFGQGSVQAIGGVLYGDYLLPFELASVLLLVGMVGAVVLTRKD